jgi:lipopolysaccharide assembly protein A
VSDHASNEGEGVPAPPESERREPPATHHEEGFRHTRTSAAWVAITIAVLFGVALIDFIAQNTRDVRLEFFSASGRIPIAVALLAAALSGAVVVLAIGVGRVAQLRLTMRRQRLRGATKTSRHSSDSSTEDSGDRS